MQLRKYAISALPLVPWANGRGVTRVLDVEPSDATMMTFEWRVSMAFVGGDGPFSVLPGVRRALAVVASSEGCRGLQLDEEAPRGHDDARKDGAAEPPTPSASSPICFLHHSDTTPFVFDGERRITATLCGFDGDVGGPAVSRHTLVATSDAPPWDPLAAILSDHMSSLHGVTNHELGILDFNVMWRPKTASSDATIEILSLAPNQRLMVVDLEKNYTERGCRRAVVLPVNCSLDVEMSDQPPVEDEENSAKHLETALASVSTGEFIVISATDPISSDGGHLPRYIRLTDATRRAQQKGGRILIASWGW